MKKIFLFFVLVCSTFSAYAQNMYKIKHIYNAKSIIIGGVPRGEKFVFPEKFVEKIEWPNYKVAVEVVNLKTGRNRFFNKKMFEKTKSISFWDFICNVFIRKNIRGRRGGTLRDLREELQDSTFYIQQEQDTLFFESPQDIGGFFVMEYYKEKNQKVSHILPLVDYTDSQTNKLVPFFFITRSMFTNANDFFDYKVSISHVIYKADTEHAYLVTDRMNIVCLPYEYEDNQDE